MTIKYEGGKETPSPLPEKAGSLTDRESLGPAALQFREIIEFLPDATFVLDRDKKVVAWNRAIELMTGVPKEEILGQGDYAYALPFYGKRTPILVDLLWSDEREAGFQYEFMGRDGDTIYGETFRPAVFGGRGAYLWAKASPLYDQKGRMVGAIETIRDITDRKKAEQALRESEARFRTLVGSIDDIVFTMDSDQRYLGVYGKWLDKFGLTPGFFIGKKVHEVFRNNGYKIHEAAVRQALAGENVVYEWLLESSRGNRYFQTSLSLIHDTGGRARLVGVGRDITRLKELENQLRRHRDHLEELVRERTAELKNANEQLQQEIAGRRRAEEDLLRAHSQLEKRVEERTAELVQVNQALQEEITERRRVELELLQKARELARSNQELEQFAYVASHDLQEPLRMVASYVQLLARRYKGRLDQDADEFISYAVDGANRMQQLISDLLAYSRVGTRGRPFEETDSGAALARALANLHISITESGAEICCGPMPAVMADASQLTQVFQNLIGNAIKFKGQEPPRIRVEAQQSDLAWVFSVSDNGIGIDPQYNNRIFVLFQRLHNRTEYSGTGIGLAICKKIVERHGGRIWLNSEEGKGTTFYFTIPR